MNFICFSFITPCGGLNEKCPDRLMCLNTWLPLDGAVWEGYRSLRRQGLLDEVYHWGQAYPTSFSFSVLPVCEGTIVSQFSAPVTRFPRLQLPQTASLCDCKPEKSFPPLGWLFYLSYRKVASHSQSGFGFNTQPGTRFLSVCCLCARRRPLQFIGGNELYMASPPSTPKSNKRLLGTHIPRCPVFCKSCLLPLQPQAPCDQKKGGLKTQAGKSLSALG